MFTTNYYIWLAICVALIAALLIISVKFKFKFKTALAIMCVTSIISELSKVFSHMTDGPNGGMVIVAYALPLHLCSIFIFIFFYMFLSKNQVMIEKLKSFFVPVGLFGATIAILTATSGVDFKAPYAYQCFIYHAVMVYFALYLIITKQVDLGLKAYIRNVITLGCLAIIMIWVNGALQNYDVNFFFIVKPPMDGLPFLNLDYGWYVYFIHLVMAGIILETSISLPYILKERNLKK